jgi:hypothetical protein
MDLITWSLPFLADKIGEMMENALTKSLMLPNESVKSKSGNG